MFDFTKSFLSIYRYVYIYTCSHANMITLVYSNKNAGSLSMVCLKTILSSIMSHGPCTKSWWHIYIYIYRWRSVIGSSHRFHTTTRHLKNQTTRSGTETVSNPRLKQFRATLFIHVYIYLYIFKEKVISFVVVVAVMQNRNSSFNILYQFGFIAGRYVYNIQNLDANMGLIIPTNARVARRVWILL